EEVKKLNANGLARLFRRAIEDGEFNARDRFPSERELSQRFRTARGTVRSALAKLEEDGYVETKPGSGTYVVGQSGQGVTQIISNARPLELIEARFALEPHSCRLSVLNARTTDFDAMEAMLEEMEASVDNPEWFSELDTRFHGFLAETTGNSLLIWMVSQINDVRNQKQWSRMRSLTLNEDTIRMYNRQHRNVFESLRQREPERAAQAMKSHLESARLSLTRSAAT
ncbi:MAG: FCD domain-containing protein, partial [Pseudomonadota bacterium]